MPTEPIAVRDPYLDQTIAAKSASAVLKVEVASLISALPRGRYVFAFEGPDDKLVYYGWIKLLRQNLKYEPFVCKTKSQVLQLLDVLERDLTGLGESVYYFIDRDFDDMQGRNPSHRVYVTGSYSIENYLVCTEVLDDILRIDFHCAQYVAAREAVCAQFLSDYDAFLRGMKELNFRIFLARKLRIRQIAELPSKIHQLAHIQLCSVEVAFDSAEALVCLEREPTDEERLLFADEFERLVPRDRYRGKFALAFFVKWLTDLRKDRLSTSPKLLAGIRPSEYSVSGAFSLGSLAPKAPAPSCLQAFLEGIPG